MLYCLEVLLKEKQKLILRSTPQHLGKKGTTGCQNLDREMRSHLAEMHDAQMVRLLVASCRSRHIGENEIRLTREQLLYAVISTLFQKIELEDGGARHRVHFQIVEADNAARLGRILVCFHTRDGDLTPAPRGAAEIDHARTGTQQAVA